MMKLKESDDGFEVFFEGFGWEVVWLGWLDLVEVEWYESSDFVGWVWVGFCKRVLFGCVFGNCLWCDWEEFLWVCEGYEGWVVKLVWMWG